MFLIEVQNLKKVYQDDGAATTALNDVSFNIDRGEFVAVMGPSGSGKSTLLHILGFLDKSTGGEYRFDGRDVNDYPPEELAALRNRKVGFIFQAFNLLPRASVLENVKLPLLYSDIPAREWNERARRAIELVGLERRLNHKPAQLSGGEKQRAAIARSFVNDPDVIFADEPTGNLDSKSGGQVMEYIEKLHAAGRTIILITHETYTAEYAERIIRLKDGLIESDKNIGKRHHQGDGFVK